MCADANNLYHYVYKLVHKYKDIYKYNHSTTIMTANTSGGDDFENNMEEEDRDETETEDEDDTADENETDMFLGHVFAYLSHGIYPEDFKNKPNSKRALRRTANRNYRVINGQLQYKSQPKPTVDSDGDEESHFHWKVVLRDEESRRGVLGQMHSGRQGITLIHLYIILHACLCITYITSSLFCFSRWTFGQGKNSVKGNRQILLAQYHA